MDIIGTVGPRRRTGYPVQLRSRIREIFRPGKDKDGNLLTTKEDTLSHGFGCRQMRKIAEKYDSTILFHPKNDTVFVVETALKLPVP